MLSEPARNLLAEMIANLAQLELAVESQREKLSLIGGFNPDFAFSLVAREGAEFISSVDILNFLDAANVFSKASESKQLIKEYDGDGDDRWSNTEFQRFVLPADNPALKTLVLNRQLGESPPAIVPSLLSLFSAELSYHRSLQPLIRRLRLHPSFTTSAAFASVTLPLSEHVTQASLRFFLSSHCISPTEGMLRAIIRRIDRDGDGRLTYGEFRRPFIGTLLYTDERKDAVQPHTSLKGCKSLSQLRAPTGETIRYVAVPSLDPHFSAKSLKSPSRITAASTPPTPPTLPTPPTSPSSKSMLLLSPRYTAGNYNRYCLPLAVRDLVSAFFEEVVASWREGDVRRKNLALDREFSLEETFQAFDRGGKEGVTAEDLVDGLYNLGSVVSLSEVSLLFRSLRPAAQSQLNFSEFCEFLLPTEYRRDGGQARREGVRGGRGGIGVLTGTKIGELVQLRVETERRLEGFRIVLKKMASFRPHEVFNAINVARDNNLCASDLRIFLEASHVSATDAELQSLLLSLSPEGPPVTSHVFSAALSPYSNHP